MIRIKNISGIRKRVFLIAGVACLVVLSIFLLIYQISKLSFITQVNEFQLFIYPAKYTPAMSSTPGIKISPQYAGKADSYRFTTDSGQFISWMNGIISELGSKNEVSTGTPVYWTPLVDGMDKSQVENVVTVEVLKDGKVLSKKQAYIEKDQFYTVKQTKDVLLAIEPQSIDDAVQLAIKAQAKAYKTGEVATEGHVILKVEENNGITTVYTVASCGWFGFQNGVFTKVSGSGNIPTVIKFYKNEKGQYILKEYKEPEDGEGYAKSIKAMFPKELREALIGNFQQIVRMQEEQAAEYLKSIGKTAQIRYSYTERKPVNIDTQALNKLFSELAKNDEFLNNCPYWIGTQQVNENGQNYIYETSQTKNNNGTDVVIFKKTKEDGSIVEQRRYEIDGHEPKLMDRTEYDLKSISVDNKEIAQ